MCRAGRVPAQAGPAVRRPRDARRGTVPALLLATQQGAARVGRDGTEAHPVYTGSTIAETPLQASWRMDELDALLELDAAAVAAGAEAGRAAAAAASTRDGFTLGYAKGGELAVEVRY